MNRIEFLQSLGLSLLGAFGSRPTDKSPDDGASPFFTIYSLVTGPVSASFDVHLISTKSVPDFVIGNVSYSNTNISNLRQLSLNHWLMQVDPIAPATATISISIPAGTCHDAFGRANLNSKTIDGTTQPFTIVYNNVVAPFNITLPVITGDSTLAGNVLTVTPGTWGGAGNTFTRQWYVDGIAAGTNSLTYTVQSTDVGKSFTVKETATNSVGSANVTSLFNWNLFFNEINLQGLPSTNLSLTGSSVNQWNSPNGGRSASQGTAANKPTYADGFLSFDGTNDSLQLSTEITLALNSGFSIYIVAKITNTTTKNFFGAASTTARAATLVNECLQLASAAGMAMTFDLGALENYNVICIRRALDGTYTVSMNDRIALQRSSFGNQSDSIEIGNIGKASTSNWSKCIIAAFCVSRVQSSDVLHALIKSQFYSLYSIPLLSEPGVLGFGDSITFQNEWLQYLATDMGLHWINSGISGTYVTTGHADNGLDRYVANTITYVYNDYLVMIYGTNDIDHSVTPAAVAAAIDTIVAGWIAAGYNPRKILIHSVPYRQAGAFATQLAACVPLIQAVATNRNCKFLDIYQLFLNQPSPDTLMKDSYHMNTAGGQITKNAQKPILLAA